MSETSPSTDAPAKAPRVETPPAEGLEQVLLLSHFMAHVGSAAPMLAGRGLSLAGFALLSSLGSEEGTPISKIARRATGPGSVVRQARRELVAAGFAQEVAGEADKKASVVLTDAGRHALSAIRADMAAATAEFDASQMRPLSRLASLVRRLAKPLAAPKADRAAKAEGGAKAKRRGTKGKRAEA